VSTESEGFAPEPGPGLFPELPREACPFCERIAAGRYDYHDSRAVAFEPLNPVTPGHFLVVPLKHVVSALESPLAARDAMSFAAELAKLMELEACNFITSAGAAASQTVMHLHVHVVPRSEGDGLALPWPQDPKCGFCYCRLAESPECAGSCAHRRPAGFAGCASAGATP
jgi:histidine triad (HIT) family protein